MSIQAMAWAMSQQIVSKPSSRLVLICLSNYAGEDGLNAFPSIKTLSSQTGLSERSVQYALKDLVDLGAIRKGDDSVARAKIKRGDRIPVSYDVIMHRGAAVAPGEDERGAICDTNGVQSVHQRGAAVAPDPLKDKPSVKENQKEENCASRSSSSHKKNNEKTFQEWLASLPEGEDAIPEDGSAFRYARDIKLPIWMLELHWNEFFDQHTGGSDVRTKAKCSNWRMTFLNSVKRNWYGIWYIDNDDEFQLGKNGKQARKAMKAMNARNAA